MIRSVSKSSLFLPLFSLGMIVKEKRLASKDRTRHLMRLRPSLVEGYPPLRKSLISARLTKLRFVIAPISPLLAIAKIPPHITQSFSKMWVEYLLKESATAAAPPPTSPASLSHPLSPTTSTPSSPRAGRSSFQQPRTLRAVSNPGQNSSTMSSAPSISSAVSSEYLGED